MSYLKIQDEESVLTKFVSAKESRTRNLQSQISLDGTEYLTRYGEPVIRYEVTAYVDERGRKKLADAADTLAVLECKTKYNRFTGRISTWSGCTYKAAGWYEVKLVLSVQSEVSTV